MKLPDPGVVRKPVHPLRRTRQLLQFEREDIVVVVIYGAAVGLLSLAVPIAVQSLVNTVAFGTLIQPLVVLAVLLGLALAAAAVLQALQVRVVEMLQRRLFVRIVTEIGRRLPRVNARVLRLANGPELLNRFFDVFTTQKSLASLLIEGMDAALIALVGMTVLAFYHPALLAFDVVLIICTVVVLVPMGRRGMKTSIAESKAKYAVAGWLEDMARNPFSFKLPGGEAFARQRVESLAASYLEKRDVHFRVVFRQIVGALSVEVVASVALLAIGGLLVIERQLSIGQLVAAELIVTAVVASVAKLGTKVEVFFDLIAAVDKLGEILDLPLEREDGSDLPPGEGQRGLVKIDEVSIRGTSKELGPLSLTIQPGQKVAIQSPSEEGSSALVDAIFGLRTPTSGVIEVDGYDLRDLSLQEARRRVAVVRDVEILPGCVKDNIETGHPDLSIQDIWQALARAGLDETVRELHEGLRTDLGMTGQPLTRQQSLQLTLARAIAEPPSILVVDRTLDQLDVVTKRLVIDRLMSIPDMSLLIVSGDPEVLGRCGHHWELPAPVAITGEAA